MKIAAQASALSGLGIGFEDDAIAEAFETALEVCDGSGREVAAKGETAGLVQQSRPSRKRDGETGSTTHAPEAGPASHPTIMGGFRAFKRRHGKDQSLRES
jgi:hypothetical protein